MSESTIYPKIPGPFKRSHATNKLTDEWSSPELEYLKDALWVFGEKVDGSNIRVIWDGYRVTFGGRTDDAQLPMGLYEWLQEKFSGPEKEQLFEQKFGDSPAVLYGEGYGPKIQNGGKYRSDISTVFYDVSVSTWWLARDGVEDVCSYFGLDVVPLVGESTLSDAIELVRAGITSQWGDFTAEGIVGVTKVGLLRRNGERLIVKLKHRDLAQ